MFETFKIHKVNDTSIWSTAPTREHSLKLLVDRNEKSVKKFSFHERINKPWNSLIQHVILTTSVISFENKLDKLWNNQSLKYNYKASPPGSDQ